MSNKIDAARSSESPKDASEDYHAKAMRQGPEMTKKRRRGKDAAIANQERIIEATRQASKSRDRRISELECENAGLRRMLADDASEYRQFRDPLPPAILERVAQLAAAGSHKELAALARSLHWLERELLEACSGVHIRAYEAVDVHAVTRRAKATTLAG